MHYTGQGASAGAVHSRWKQVLLNVVLFCYATQGNIDSRDLGTALTGLLIAGYSEAAGGVCRNGGDDDAEWRAGLEEELKLGLEERRRISERHTVCLKTHHEFFHPVWGQMLKAGYQNSMYANLMERFACLYTSHVSNLLLFSPYVKFRGRVDVMAHEHLPAPDDHEIGCDQNINVVPDVRSRAVGNKNGL